MAQGKPLLPTLRTKRRYVVWEVQGAEPRQVFPALSGSYRECFGIHGLGRSGLMDTRITAGQRGIVKVDRDHLDELRAAMAMVTHMGGREATVRTVAVSGILKKAKGHLETK